jgi:hypothetical protein
MANETIKDLFPNRGKKIINEKSLTEYQKKIKDLEFINEHTKLLGHIKSVGNKRVFCLKGIVKERNRIFNVGDCVWYIGPGPQTTDGFQTLFIAGKNKIGKWANVKFKALQKGSLEFRYIDVPEGFANDRGLYKLTKDQIIPKVENAINLRKKSIEQHELASH